MHSVWMQVEILYGAFVHKKMADFVALTIVWLLIFRRSPRNALRDGQYVIFSFELPEQFSAHVVAARKLVGNDFRSVRLDPFAIRRPVGAVAGKCLGPVCECQQFQKLKLGTRVHSFCFSDQPRGEIVDLLPVSEVCVLRFETRFDDLAQELFSLVRIIVEQQTAEQPTRLTVREIHLVPIISLAADSVLIWRP